MTLIGSMSSRIAAVCVGAALMLAGCGSPKTQATDEDAPVAALDGGEAQAGQTAAVPEPQTPEPVRWQEMSMVYVDMQTNKGSIVLELDQENAPISVQNFMGYAESGGYNGTIFHRVIDNFMIQGGGMEPDLDRRPTNAPIKNEWQNGLKNARGTVAMARLGNQPDSATNQFFINVSDNDFLDTPRDGAGYAVFGRVVEGMGVIDSIKGVRTTTRGGLSDVPVDPIIIEDVQVLSTADAAKYTGGSN